MSVVVEQFGLDEEQTLLLFSLQRSLIAADIAAEDRSAISQKKKQWLGIWEKGVNDILENFECPVTLIKDRNLLEEHCRIVVNKCTNLKTPLYLILLELSLFNPYYPLGDLSWKFYEKVNYSNKKVEPYLKKVSTLLGIRYNFINIYKKTFNKSVKSLSGFYKKMLIGAGAGTLLVAITAGFAAPVIGAMAAPAGLFGAAAVNAGLAALGGGAVAAGGLGIAGGTAVIVGGGSIFGAMSGTAIGAVLGRSSDFALLESAKLEVVMKEIILQAQKDTRFAQEILGEQKKIILNLEQQLSEFKFNTKENKEQIKNLEKSIDFLRNSLSNSQSALNNFDNGDDDKKKE
ncbi:hypothetical protein ANABIO32_23820 [Rossellomorea marisflavi]|uniref:hypothetical protein n=1 Tax=Rossellomorea marisflavi TaxID=189381 RepID=UPI0025CB17AD|nr:hypothetical protein [Rossellomorea marisflavi]GLI84671.1 hypothetical protein ANABIO32_23820 [Rossellomorea marisflavi]